jgi:hypothetical protein
MKKLVFPLLWLAVVLTGCLVTSVYPFYTEKDLSFEPGLVGQWANPKESGECWRFEKDGEKTYKFTYNSNGKISVMQARLFKLGSQSFLDMFTTVEPKDEVQPWPIPAHFLMRADQLTPTVKLAPLNYEWLQEFLAKNPKALRHHLISSGDKSEDTRLVLTADTAELQRFILKHLKTEDAWKDGLELSRDTHAVSR